MTAVVIFWLAVAMVFYTIGEIFSKLFANSPSTSKAIAAIIGYTLNAVCFLPALKYFNSLSVLGTIWNICYVVITLGLGIFIFGESLTVVKLLV